MKDSIEMGGNPLRRNINKRIIRIQEITLFVIKLRNINQIYSFSRDSATGLGHFNNLAPF